MEERVASTTMAHEKGPESSTWTRFLTITRAWYMLIFHLLACIGLSLALIYAVDGYKALDGTSTPRYSTGKFTLRSGAITTLISTAVIILNVIVGIWCSTALAQCAFAELETSGLTIAQFNRMMAWPNIPRLKFTGTSGLVMLILLANFPQAYIAPILEGSVNWAAAFQAVGDVPVASGNPEADYNLWGWYGSKLQDRQAAVRRAAGMANLAWATTNGSAVSGAARKRCRHIVNDDQLPANSRLANVTMPCIIINSITWPTAPGPDIVQNVAADSELLSLSETTAFSFVNYPGNAILFDQTNTTLKLPFESALANQEFLNLEPPTYPSSFKFSGMMTAIVLLGKHYLRAPYFVDGFGYPQPENNFSTDFLLDQLDFTYLEVHFTVGVTTAPTSTYISSQVVEGDTEPQEDDIAAGPWVHEALYLLPDVMSMVAVMNTTSLNTWGNLFNYTENLIRYSYQGSWDMLQRSFDPNTTTLVATIADPRVQATVSHVRVYCWLAINLLLTASIFPLLRLKAKCNRNIVVDGPLALLLTDPTGLFEDSRENKHEKHHLSNLAFPSNEEEKIKIRLGEMPNGNGGFKLNKVGVGG